MSERWTLEMDGRNETFESGEALLQSVKEEVYRLLAGSPMAHLTARDGEGHAFDLTLDLGLERRE